MKNLFRTLGNLLRGGANEEIDLGNVINQALDISGNHVMCLDLRRNCVFDLHGKAMFGNNVGIDVCYTYIHEEDRPGFRNFIERLRSGTVREDECRYRWDYNYTGHGDPDWHNMHSYAIAEYDSSGKRPVNIIATLTDETQLVQKERSQSELSEKYRLIFEHSLVGLSFYTADGWLLDANERMRQICNFDSDQSDSFFSSANLFDMPPFNEVLDRNNLEDYWACSLSVIPERSMHVYLEVRLHPIRNDRGEVVYIYVGARDVTEERELYCQARLNDEQLKKANEAIQVYERELRYMMESCEMQSWRISLDRRILEFYSGLSTVVRSFPLEQMHKIFVDQDDEFVKALSNPAKAFAHPLFYIGKMNPVVSGKKTEPQWVQINAIPEYDEEGRLKGAFGVWRNVMQLMRKQEQLREETERARDSGRMKSVFLANMTHEIRTPLNAIVGFSDLLQSVESADDKREMIRIIHNNCDMLLRLINDILALSNVDTNSMQIVSEQVDFAREFEDICQSLSRRVSEPGVEFITDNPYKKLLITIDKDRIQQVITNFVTNAVKYTRQGHVKVGYRLQESAERAEPGSGAGQGLYVYCEDTGSGIPADQQARVFERFVKLNDYIQGTGLGLSICKAIIEKSNGHIGVQSEEGKGSTFWFWIPVEVKSEKAVI